MGQLEHFSNLYCFSARDVIASLIDFDDVLNLPQLRELELSTDAEVIRPSQGLHLSSTRPCFNVRSLKASVHYDDHLFAYVMKRFQNLRHLELHLYNPRTASIKRKQDDYFANHLQTILDYLQSIPRHELSIGHSPSLSLARSHWMKTSQILGFPSRSVA
ncbi:hypothetical protein G6F68_014515 [Rhizopus microsporus]|nr:hypothetical protein G6F68_014515 [Rhizopus microsporus]